MVIGYHFILSAYGFWLPNDPRGSWSEVVRAYHLRQFGPATKVTDSRSHAADRHDHQRRQAAKRALKHPAVKFTGKQAVLVAKGFAVAAAESGYRINALAIMPDHSHLVMSRHAKHYKIIAAHLKAKATHQLRTAGEHPPRTLRFGKGKDPEPVGSQRVVPLH